MVREAFYELKSNGGTRSIKAYLIKHHQTSMSRRKIGLLMREAGLKSRTAKKFKHTEVSKANDPRIKPDLVQRCFDVSLLNTVYTGDITYLKTTAQTHYLAVYMDLCSRRVVGWKLDSNMKSQLVEGALSMALTSRKTPDNLIVHTDQGSQFISHSYLKLLTKHNIRQSMSRRGNCWDNSVIESFFKTFKTEVIYQLGKRPTPEELRKQVSTFMAYYNHKRPHSHNDYLSPVEFEETLKRSE